MITGYMHTRAVRLVNDWRDANPGVKLTQSQRDDLVFRIADQMDKDESGVEQEYRPMKAPRNPLETD